ncbi:hypothetical protein ACFL3E_02555 [Patescibacteria group bacterium]
MKKALAYNTYGNIDVRRMVAEYVFEFLKQGGKRDNESLKNVIDYAIEKIEKNIQQEPKNVKWYMYQGELYNLGAIILTNPEPLYAKKAEELFLKSKEMSSGRLQIYLELAQAYKVQGEFEKMWQVLHEAIEILPDHPLSHINILAHAIELNDREKESSELEWLHYHNAEFYNDVIRDAYYNAGRINDAINMQVAKIHAADLIEVRDISNIELSFDYSQLAALYKEAGLYNNAREAALKAVELDPSQRDAAEAFLQSLPK